MSKNSFGRSGNALLRRRWLAREAKRKDEQNTGRKKAKIMRQMQRKRGERESNAKK